MSSLRGGCAQPGSTRRTVVRAGFRWRRHPAEFPAAFRARFHAILAAAASPSSPARGDGRGRAPLGQRHRSRRMIFCGPRKAAPARWLAQTGFPRRPGFLHVDQTLRVSAATTSSPPATPSRLHARAAEVGCLCGARGAGARGQHPPQPDRQRCGQIAAARSALSCSTGERHALGARNGVVVEGAWVLALEGLDRSPLHGKFNELPEMTTPPAAHAAARRRRRSRKFPASPCAAAAAAPRSARRVLDRARSALSSRPLAPISWSASTRRTTRRSSMSAATSSHCKLSTISARSSTTLTCSARSPPTIRSATLRDGRGAETALAIATVPYGLEAKVEADCPR